MTSWTISDIIYAYSVIFLPVVVISGWTSNIWKYCWLFCADGFTRFFLSSLENWIQVELFLSGDIAWRRVSLDPSWGELSCYAIWGSFLGSKPGNFCCLMCWVQVEKKVINTEIGVLLRLHHPHIVSDYPPTVSVTDNLLTCRLFHLFDTFRHFNLS